ncbi:hypothetical protein KJ596_01395 [Patescibacteria group bacterium]|nr:hypothetical protein [Patescibacteria group bacterium]MBU1868091.1 hypothetical protein [Patescibacteria group bacterium]
MFKASKESLASYFFAGVLSKDFWQEEQEYFKNWWEKVREVSPKLIEEAEKYYEEGLSRKPSF